MISCCALVLAVMTMQGVRLVVQVISALSQYAVPALHRSLPVQVHVHGRECVQSSYYSDPWPGIRHRIVVRRVRLKVLCRDGV